MTDGGDGVWVVVGLGNPGARYAGNRHNVGHMVLDELAARAGARFTTHRTQALVADARLGTGPGGVPGPRVVLAKPTTYMNVSGGPVAGLLKYFAVPVDRLVVVHDDFDIPFGDLRLKRGGGEGGHNGLRSISASLGTRDYVRVRFGIGRPPGRMEAAQHVLRDFSAEQRRELPLLLDEAADAVGLIVTSGLEAAQLRVHTKEP